MKNILSLSKKKQTAQRTRFKKEIELLRQEIKTLKQDVKNRDTMIQTFKEYAIELETKLERKAN